ncbi:MAG: hypothetical protein KC425_13015, partial [Anaerolineales bacterium]|nr:hypothetical protein [Anaerolineales bacterium]
AVQPPDVDLATLYSDTYDSRRVMSFPIGLNTDLKPQIVTLREDSQGGLGHHAMLAGGIGKGKSVTLQSIVLALAASNSPAHLNFVLADFKGGASELGRLRTLPHVVGFVTDLDEAYVERFRLALEGEVLRRKQILDDTPRTFGRQIPNIYEYNRAVAPEEIMPHLVVVIDEFAKAIRINAHFKKTVDNDITAQGRALGIHLILSTQKAQDFEGIRLNIEVRMSMQVQTTEDSRVIFGRDDAATKLTRAGQALLQVGNNRVFEMFQVARTDIPYVPEGAGNIDLVDDFTIRQIAPNGRRHTLYKHRPQMQITDHASRLSEAEVLVRHIADYCQTRYAPTRTICLPPLPPAESMPVFDLLQKQHPAVFCPWQRQSGWDTAQKSEHYRLQAPLGMLDLPSQQLQQPYILNLNERDGNLLIVGPTGSGKSLLLQTLVLAFASTHAPDDLAFYFWGQGPAFVTLAELPHSPAFIQPAETERTQRLLGFLEKEMARRRALLGELRAGNMEALRRARPDLPLPAVVIILDD